MIWIDYVIIGIIVFSDLVSLMRRFVREVLSLVTWACVFLSLAIYYSYLAICFTHLEEQMVRNSITIALLFVATLIIGAVFNT